MNENTSQKFLQSLQKNNIHVIQNASLKNFTSFGIGGIANFLLYPDSQNKICTLLKLCKKHNIIPKILGGGTNLLVASPSIPVVISTKKLTNLFVTENVVYSECGTNFARVISKSINSGLSLENLAGIPGSLGGAIYGNAGGKANNVTTSIGDYVAKITCVSSFGDVITLPKNQIKFDYRTSNLQSHFILSAELTAPLKSPDILKAEYKKNLKNKIQKQPYNQKSAGCIFKNTDHISAWKLICDAGLQGTKIGDVAISSKHSNFIVNMGNGSAQNVQMLIRLIQKRIQNEFGIDLALEIQIW